MPRNPRKGRPTALLEPGVEETFLTAIAQGTPLHHAAIAAGIHPATFRRWMDKGAAADEQAALAETEGRPHGLDAVAQRYRAFRAEVIRLRARVSTENVRRIDKVAEGGFLVKRSPLVSKDGSLVRGDDGEVLYVEEFAPPDWKAAKFLLETSFAREFKEARQEDPTALHGATEGAEDGDVVRTLAERISALASERRREIEAAPEDVVEAEIVDDTDTQQVYD